MRLTPNDLPILRELLGWGYGNFPKGSLGVSTQRIAETTGLHRNTIARRLKALHDGGVVAGYLFEPHPAALGLVRAGHRFDGPATTRAEDVATLLRDFPWVSVAALHMDSCFLHTWHEDAATVDDDVKALGAALGARHVVFSFRSDQWPPSPADALHLSGLDRRLVMALRRGPRRSVGAVARDAGATRRTAARHLDRLADANAGAMLPIFRPCHIEGHLIAIFDGPARPDAVASVQQAFPDRIMGPVVAGPRVMAMVPVKAADEASRLKDDARALPGLEGLEMQILRDMLFPEPCDAWLAERVQNAPDDVAST